MRICAGEDVSAFLPRAAAEIFAREKTRGRGPVLPEALESALLSRLRMLPQTAYNALPGATEGLGNSRTAPRTRSRRLTACWRRQSPSATRSHVSGV